MNCPFFCDCCPPPSQWSDETIMYFYDTTGVTLGRLSQLTGRSIRQLKFLLKLQHILNEGKQ